MISKKDVQYIASLSRIYLNEDEAVSLTNDLEKILEYVNKLNKLETSKVPPTSHVLPIKNVFRDDVVKTSLSQEETLNFSVEDYKGSFKVPKVIE